MAGGSKRSKRARLDDSESEDISDQENLQVFFSVAFVWLSYLGVYVGR